MEATKFSRIRRLITFSLAIACAFCSSQNLLADSTKPAVQIDLGVYGGKISKLGSRIDHAVVILPDGTTWVTFPVEAEGGLSHREGPLSPGFGFLHISLAGKVISQCTWHMVSGAVENFFPRESGFTIRTTTSLLSLDSDCKLKAELVSPGVGVEATSDGTRLVIEGDKAIRVLDSDSLLNQDSIELPGSLPRYHRAFVWNQLLMLRDSAASPCYWTTLSSGHPHVWRTVSCPEETMRLFGDDAIISSNRSTSSTNISVDTLQGGRSHVFSVATTMKTDASMFPFDSCLSPESGRAGIFLFDQKRSWTGAENIAGEHVDVIDFRKGQTLLTLPVTEYDPLLNCSLSRNGKTFALLRGLNLSLFDLPD